MTLPPPRPKKRWGQNFFRDPALIESALEPLNLSADDAVLEIGPGRGILTELLLARGAQVLALEIDPELIPLLREKFADQPRLELRQLDFMHYDLNEFYPELPAARRKLIANIPYHLTSPILLKVLNETGFRAGIGPQTPYFSEICLMVQQEVADKLLATPGTKAYNALSVTVGYAAEVERLADLPRQLFDPPPKVDSSLIRLRPRTAPPVEIKDLPAFWHLLARCYQLRRKNLRNVLKSLGHGPEAIEAAAATSGIELARRGETLDLAELARLSNGLS